MMAIYANGHISIDDNDTGLIVSQQAKGTVVCQRENMLREIHYKEITMPQQRYSLAHDNPASGAAGRAQFEADLYAVLKAMAGLNG